ncbi:ABC transporter permease [Thermanaerovibrio acidaminovorans]|jgi:peptide/nickel transport system permease protein/oligopeptide transport system permease protein|uniref:Binding-protein-dependent transport systems inner membrane component n=1 Tax=Thermanaerovibrio acidaminovorans (strain ATCC 49978 / DSM 6589 / Su883) TaxID=525903 RepID=D1B7J9_THEAS|nr:ABC transporter permease [Thermanaerovibrio acidaminovorans]ACZ18252.1 binding-protein-dependent transport systems inner membrane component [Thermanaerovibrio acidaminovorans DSM 6589]
MSVSENVTPNVCTAVVEEPKPRSLWADAWLRFKRNKLAMAGLIMTITVILAAVFAPVIAPYDPVKQLIWTEGMSARLAAPSAKHIMGTDLYGRDIFSRILYGARISLQIGIFATVVSLLIGIPMGAIAGYVGGKVDDFISWVMNVIYAFPFLLFVLAVVAVFKDPGLSTVYVAIGLISWVSIARVLRAQFMQLREMEFVEAAKALGLPSWRILFVHILPSAMAPVIVQATMGMGGIIMIEAGLAFLGFGAQPPTPSWGLMISEGQQYLASGIWWWSIFPGLAIMYTVLAFNFLGDGLRDALDVRMKR